MLRPAPVRRWTAEERDRRLASSLPFNYDSPSVEELEDLVRRYKQITGDLFRDDPRRPAKKNYIATCYRVHGDDTLPFIAEEFARTGTFTNLLGVIRFSPPRAQPQRDRGVLSPRGTPVSPGTDWSIEEVRAAVDEAEGQSHRGERLEAPADAPSERGRSHPASRTASAVDPSLEPGRTASAPVRIAEQTSTREASRDVTISCSDFHEHQLTHHWVGDRFQCGVCGAVSS